MRTHHTLWIAPSHAQTGVAVVMVMLIVALATSMAVFIAQQQNFWQRQLERQIDHAQARRLSIAGIDWARAVLADDARTNSIDHAGEMWTLRLPAMPVDNGEVIGVIEDQQGLFNLNKLAHNGVSSPEDVAQFQRLLSTLGLPAELALTLADWLDADSEVQAGGGAEDAYYLALPQPYRSANRNLSELGELALVKGFDSHSIERLRPFVSVLPFPTALNVNFAPAEVLAASIAHLSVADARLVVQQRRGKPYQDLADFKQRLPRAGIDIVDSNFSVSSQFFWVTGRAKMGQTQVITQALLQRTGGWPNVVWQSVQ